MIMINISIIFHGRMNHHQSLSFHMKMKTDMITLHRNSLGTFHSSGWAFSAVVAISVILVSMFLVMFHCLTFFLGQVNKN
jgi:hypothetical protein